MQANRLADLGAKSSGQPTRTQPLVDVVDASATRVLAGSRESCVTDIVQQQRQRWPAARVGLSQAAARRRARKLVDLPQTIPPRGRQKISRSSCRRGSLMRPVYHDSSKPGILSAHAVTDQDISALVTKSPCISVARRSSMKATVPATGWPAGTYRTAPGAFAAGPAAFSRRACGFGGREGLTSPRRDPGGELFPRRTAHPSGSRPDPMTGAIRSTHRPPPGGAAVG